MNPNFQSTPIKIGDRLYTSTNLGQAAALDPVTGEELWRYDPYASGLRDVIGGRSNRGVAYWSDGTSERVFLASGEYLVSLDAATGLSDEAFGNGGAVDLAADEGTEGALSILPIAGGKTFRAGDKESGEVVWEMEMAAGTSGAPMTYLSNGRQFNVVAIGDRDTPGRLVALALPLVGD